MWTDVCSSSVHTVSTYGRARTWPCLYVFPFDVVWRLALLSQSSLVMHAHSHATHTQLTHVVHAVHDNLCQVSESAQVCMA